MSYYNTHTYYLRRIYGDKYIWNGKDICNTVFEVKATNDDNTQQQITNVG